MQFLSPWYLLGALAVAVPILLHLRGGRKVTVVPWAAHRFLITVTRQLQKRRRLENLILLLLRCLLVLLLALLFARPFAPGQKDVLIDEQNHLVLVVDASASMGMGNWIQTRFDRAGELVDQMLEPLPRSTQVSLILFADRAYPVVESPVSDHNLIRSELNRQQPRSERSNLPAGLSAAINLLSSRGGGSIVVITDGQAAAWSDREALIELSQRARAASINLQLQLVEDRSSVQNLGIVAFEPLLERPITGQPLQLQALVRNGGDSVSSATRLLLEKTPGAPIKEVPIPALEPGEVATVVFETRFDRSGAQLLTARLPGDSFAADDRRTVGLQVSGGLRVGIVAGAVAGNARIPPGFFIRAAAVPVTGPEKATFPIKEELLDADILRDADKLAAYDIIVLTGVGRLGPSEADGLRRYLSQGGGLWINPPSNLDVAAQFVADPAVAEFTAGTRLSLGEPASVLVGAPPYQHSITGFWNQVSAGSLDSFPVDRYLRIAPSDLLEPVLKLANGDWLFATTHYEAGRVFLSAIPMDREWSDFPLAAQFVPLVQRILKWLGGMTPAAPEVAPHGTWQMEVAADQAGLNFYVLGPSSGDAPQEAGKVEMREGRAQVVFSETGPLGSYRVFVGTNPVAIGAFGVNLPAAETDLRRIAPDIVDPFGSEASELTQIERQVPGWLSEIARIFPETWALLAIFLLMVALLESFFAYHFSRPR